MPLVKFGKHDFGFIHFAKRSNPLKAVEDAEKYKIDGNLLHISLLCFGEFHKCKDKTSRLAYVYGFD